MKSREEFLKDLEIVVKSTTPAFKEKGILDDKIEIAQDLLITCSNYGFNHGEIYASQKYNRNLFFISITSWTLFTLISWCLFSWEKEPPKQEINHNNYGERK